MDQQTYAAVMHRLETFTREVGTECQRERLESGVEELRFLAALQADGTDLAWFRLAVVQLEGMDLAQVYVTVLARLGQAREQLAQAIAQWNAHSPLGQYGIDEAQDQLYHRSRLSLDGQAPAAKLAEQIMAAVTLVHEELSCHSRAAHAMVAGASWQQVRDWDPA